MALVTCPECGKETSDRAESCPHCGCPRQFFSSATVDLRVGDTYTCGFFRGDSLEWRVIAVEDNKALLITDKVIECMPYNEEYEPTTWAVSDMRHWLNGEFLNTCFSDAEKARMAEVTLETPDNDEFNTPGGGATQDRIFCLSIAEAEKYFKNDDARVCLASKNALNHGIWHGDGSEACYWWLRSPGLSENTVATVFSYGTICNYGANVSYTDYGVRPAFWMQL